MIVKLISLSLLLCSLLLGAFHIQNPDDPLFYIISDGLGASFLRIALSAVLVLIVFKPELRKPALMSAFGVIGVLLLFLGISGFMTSPGGFGLYSSIRPLDFPMMMLTGTVLTILALEKPAITATPASAVLVSEESPEWPRPFKDVRRFEMPSVGAKRMQGYLRSFLF